VTFQNTTRGKNKGALLYLMASTWLITIHVISGHFPYRLSLVMMPYLKVLYHANKIKFIDPKKSINAARRHLI
jgi:hypothetical protein